jgi:hypothetical protein
MPAYKQLNQEESLEQKLLMKKIKGRQRLYNIAFRQLRVFIHKAKAINYKYKEKFLA